MNDFKDCLLVVDIDGTLAEGWYVAPDNITAIEQFNKDGGTVVLATGRSPQSAVPIAEKIKCSGTVIANNGGIVYDCASEKVVIEYELGCSDAAFQVLEKFPSAGALFYCGRSLWLVKNNETAADLIRSENLTVLDKCDETVNKVLISDEPSVTDEIERYCLSLPDLDGDVVRTSDCFVELLPKGIDKGKAMTDLAASLGCKKENLFAAGNYYNDITMLEKAGVSCAPSDSPDEIKRYADYVACTCREGAVAEFIWYLYKRFNIRR